MPECQFQIIEKQIFVEDIEEMLKNANATDFQQIQDIYRWFTQNYKEKLIIEIMSGTKLILGAVDEIEDFNLIMKYFV